jgi:hypothetical protein
MKVEIRNEELKLAEIAEQALEFITPNEDSQPAVKRPELARELYDLVVDWSYALPDRIRLEEAVLPSTLILKSAT